MFRELFPSVLTHAECAQAIATAEMRGFEAMAAKYPHDYRNNDRAVVDDPLLAAELFSRLRPHLPPHWDEAGARWRLLGLNPRFRFCRYRDGQQFTRHRDGAWSRVADERSWLTVMLYLNDAGEFTGGATRFYSATAADSVPPREGQAIVFDHRLWHDGEAVTAGTKYVMRTDVMYRLERAGAEVGPSASGALKRERVLSGHTGYVWVVRRLADGRLVSGSRDCTVRAWGDGELLREGLTGSAMAIVEVGPALWTGGRHGEIHDGQRGWHAHDGAVLGLERLPDGSVVSCGADGAIRKWAPTGEAMGELARHPGWVRGLTIDGDQVLAAVEPVRAVAVGARGDRDGVIRLDDGRSWRAHEGAVTTLVSIGGRWVSGGEDSLVKVWSSDGQLLGEGAHRDFVRSLAVLDSGRVASASYDGTVVIWQVSGSTAEGRRSPVADH